ncbi:MATE family efflux transporter [Bradyrhizobium amphicarpaeae]|uniref:Multidrug-efflux transporter n=1 Tax=Bradyrhizobium amphicarpaeae TaxID=1404768 RepID=A0A2U8Q1Z2_9BRAD|nr:MATE family efflux transporter [Bradyrhizobium amphicarpaeae]AWM04074.1 MATE family efflux transporter [Bradyrhizobium amphicarpaeae]
MLDTSQHQSQPQAGVPQNHLAEEFVETLRLAVPMMLTQLGQIAMITTDLALIGRLGEDSVAAAALAHTVYFVSFTFGLGLMSAVSPLAAQAFGAGDVRRVRGSLRVGLWAALLISLPMMASPLYGKQILIALGQAPQMAELAQHYLNGLAWGIAPALGFIALRSMMSAVNRPQPPLWITVAAIPVNAVLVYVLIHGLFGLPEFGLFGAGLATTIVNLGTFVATMAIAAWRKPFVDYRPLAHLWRIDWALMRQLIAVGAPISFSLLLEYGLFSSAALLMGLISTTAIAAHQIALQMTAVLFMVPLGIGMAATVRVGHAYGRGDSAAVKRAGLAAVGLGVTLVTALTIGIVLGRYELGRLFFGRGEASAPTVALTATLLLVGSTFFIADGLQTIMGGALRGINDTRMTLLFAAIGYWGIAFPTGWLLAFHTGLGAVGIWVGFSVGTFVYAGLLILRFQMLTRRLAG